ncbi:MAG: c-type cytochrome [Mariprofundales bacterium]
MMLRLLVALVLMVPASVVAQPLAVDSVTVQRGRVVAEVRCKQCHFLTRTNRKIGPGLLGIFNRKPMIQGVPFANWDAPALEQWLTSPQRVKPNTKMRIPPLAARDRAAVIAWLATNHE